jgi:hypothetical protein
MKSAYSNSENGHVSEKYWEFLGEIARIFGELYANFSPYGREKAILALSELFQVECLDPCSEGFFISPVKFLSLDLTQLTDFLNEKFGVILAFLRRALHRRKVQLGIYATVEEYKSDVIEGADDRQRLISDLGILQWFLDSSTENSIESVFAEIEPETLPGLQVPEEEIVLTEEETIIFDNENRPPK